MPQLPPAPGVTQAILGFTWDGQRCANVLHFITGGGGTTPDPTVLGDRLISWWSTNIRPKTPSTVSLTSVTCTDLGAGTSPGVIRTTGLPLIGGDLSTSMPNNVAIVMSLKTGLRGKSFRGRIYHVGLSDAVVTANAVTTVQRDALVAGYSLLTTFAGATGEAIFNLVVLSYYASSVLRPTPIATPVTSVTSDGIVDSQRRRLPGRGR